ncbi:ABC transporter ATP-binding protein [Clostridium magnum]|uniref:ABC-type quaternary amine transporter n=1 Tax=Clostridium magnum DSM 2767 TaxID=1121326 RepID=A0A162RRE5_9CLOT|nr:ABC transporter ATP-binding protein [Clostridium magnum]KZL90277.1 spermidine/putrescine import ATP-binding protein PotA [Clostridium magnum DSM 2767]SHH80841.1 ABC-type Fe3+/spermidine/putrescine transport systems, ATPase components [Clostridium magnum DSM 2767]
MTKLQMKNLNKSFDDIKVLKDINFFIADGEIVSLLGESGCGKSTTLKIIAGLIEPDSGDIILDEASILNVQAEKRKTVIVFQDHLLFPHLNIEDNIGFGLKMAGIKKSIRKNKVAEIVSLLKLQGLEKRYPKELSGGQRQRVALGRALAIEPKVLLLDEPFSNLDIRLREEMRELVLGIQRKLGITTILVTHDKEEALMMSDKIAVMIDGEIPQFDTPENIYEKPVSSSVADFFGEKNYIEGSVKNGIFECKFGSFQVDLPLIKSGKMMIKPEKIELLCETEDCSMNGVVKKKRYLGDKVHYTVEVEGKELKVISSEYMGINVGENVRLKIDFSKGIFYPHE